MAKSKVPYISEGSFPEQREYTSRSVRKIDNGYIISETIDGPGGYSCSERFSERPMGEGSSNGPGETKGSLKDAILSLKG